MTTSSSTGFETMSSTLFNKLAQDRLVKNFVFHRFADKRKFPKNSGQVFQFNRYVNVDGTTATLTEGTLTAGEVNMSADTATLTIAQYGQFTKLTQFLTATNRTTVIEEAVEVLADAASDTVDLLHRDDLVTNGKQRIAGGKTTATLVNGDKLTADELRLVLRNMQANNVRPFSDGGCYVGVYSPYQIYDLQGDTAQNSWTEVSKYTDKGVNNIYGDELGKLYNARLIRSNNVATTSVTSSVTSAYQGFVLGNHFQAAVDLESTPIEIIVNLPGSAGSSDPYRNIATVAYKLPGFGVKWLGFGATANSFRAYRHITAVSA